jgi:hypothetical protein
MARRWLSKENDWQGRMDSRGLNTDLLRAGL